MAKKKPQHKCDQCFRSFDSDKGLSIHKTRASHWFKPKPPIPPPPSEHTNYFDLVVGSLRSWGEQMTVSERRSPTRENLKLGALLFIGQTLKEILEELKKPKTLK